MLLALTQVALVGSWTLAGLEDSINDKLKELDSKVDAQHVLEIRNVQMAGAYYALITYEIEER